MIFEIAVNEDGEIDIGSCKSRLEWIEGERDNIEGTILEADAKLYLKQFAKTADEIDLDRGGLRIIIEGKIIVPQVKESIKEIDL